MQILEITDDLIFNNDSTLQQWKEKHPYSPAIDKSFLDQISYFFNDFDQQQKTESIRQTYIKVIGQLKVEEEANIEIQK